MLWNKNLETGISEIDAQHKELFRQIDILMDVKNDKRIKETLNFLSDYILKHFSDEEKMHRASNYPKAAMHKGYHDNYVKVFKQLKSKVETEGEVLTNKLAVSSNVVDWLKNHIMVHDLEFAKYYKTQNAAVTV